MLPIKVKIPAGERPRREKSIGPLTAEAADVD
jgi:hypothetical protein